jgi:molecular chaperone GrpE (heat shock protein)
MPRAKLPEPDRLFPEIRVDNPQEVLLLLEDNQLFLRLLSRLQRKAAELALRRRSSEKPEEALRDAGIAEGAFKMLDVIDVVLNEARGKDLNDA